MFTCFSLSSSRQTHPRLFVTCVVQQVANNENINVVELALGTNVGVWALRVQNPERIMHGTAAGEVTGTVPPDVTVLFGLS